MADPGFTRANILLGNFFFIEICMKIKELNQCVCVCGGVSGIQTYCSAVDI